MRLVDRQSNQDIRLMGKADTGAPESEVRERRSGRGHSAFEGGPEGWLRVCGMNLRTIRNSANWMPSKGLEHLANAPTIAVVVLVKTPANKF